MNQAGIKDEHIDSIRKITLEPQIKSEDRDHLYVQLTAIYSSLNKNQYLTRYEGISKEDELSFFYKLNHLVYILEKKNIQDIIMKRGINNDIYNVLNYLFMKYRKKRDIENDKFQDILNFIRMNFNLENK